MLDVFELVSAVLSHKVFNAPTYLVVIAAALSVVYVVLVVRFFLHMKGLGVTWSGKKKKMALLLGPRNAGKTQFFHAIRDGEYVDTVSSMKEATFRFQVHPKYNPTKFDAELTVVDYPGHERLRSRVADFYPVAGCIVFFVDASDAPSFRKAAEFLYDIFSSKKINDDAPPMMIACSKSDAAGAASPQAVQSALEKELTQLKKTRSSLETEGDDEQDLSQVPVGREDTPFSFDVDAPCAVTFVKCSVKSGAVNDLVSFIQKN